MTIRISSWTDFQARILAQFCLTWNCTSISLSYDEQLHLSVNKALGLWPIDVGPFSKRVFSSEQLDTVAQLILIFLSKQERARYPPSLRIDSGRVSTIHNFMLRVSEGLIEIQFANIYHAEILCTLGLHCQTEVTSLDTTQLTTIKRWEVITPQICCIHLPKDLKPCPETFDFHRWPHAADTFNKYKPPSESDARMYRWWTPRHDDLLRIAIEQNGWRWHPPVKAILTIAPIEYSEEFANNGGEDSCLKALGYYCERRALQVESCLAALPTLKWLKCPICEQYFHQQTVARYCALKLAVVCSVCHREGFKWAPSADPTHEWTRTEVLDHIRALFAASGGRFDLPQSVIETFDADQYVILVRLWRLQPPRGLVRQLFGSFFAARVEAGVISEAWVRLSRGTRCIARDGHTCLSLGEKTICDWLFDNGVSHRREVPYGNGCNYVADWEIQGHLFEYLGLTGDEKYDLKTEKKIDVAQRQGLSLIPIYPRDLENLSEVFAKVRIDRPNLEV